MSPYFFILSILLLAPRPTQSLNEDGVLLLSFKYSVLNDPLNTLTNWAYDDDNPCAWNGVMCMGFNSSSRVISLVLPNSNLLGSIPDDVAQIKHLRHLDLSNNLLNGTLPNSLFNATELRIVSLANNQLSGEIPDVATDSLKLLNLSDNAFTGRMPVVRNASVVSLRNNFLSGGVVTGFGQVQVLDISSNLLNGSLPSDLTTFALQYLNVSSNSFTGEILVEIPDTAVVDFSYNNFTGGIPSAAAFAAQKPEAYAGNPGLCGKPLKNLCTIPSSLSNPPNVTESSVPESPPALAAMPKSTGVADESSSSSGFKPATIAAIVIGDLGGIGVLVVVFLYVYHVKKRRTQNQKTSTDSEAKANSGLCCLRKNDGNSHEITDTSSSASSSESEEDEEAKVATKTLVIVDGDSRLEMETLLKASAYILGATGSTIVYKAVLADGTALAVRRIGECVGVEKVKDLEAQVRSIARIRHVNVLRIWGFYWGPDEKLLIHDYAANGSLANISFTKKMGSSPFNMSWETRVKIARGIARGLAYIHEKKAVHGNIKPSNILLDSEMEPKIADLGLDRLLTASRAGASARLFGSKRSMHSQTSVPESSPGPSWSPYQAPESMKNIKVNAKCDVYAFGVVLLELISGRVFSEEELAQWNSGFVAEERGRIVRMVDPAVRGEMEGKEEAIVSCFKLGFSCASVVPQRRPSMKDVVMILEKI